MFTPLLLLGLTTTSLLYPTPTTYSTSPSQEVPEGTVHCRFSSELTLPSSVFLVVPVRVSPFFLKPHNLLVLLPHKASPVNSFTSHFTLSVPPHFGDVEFLLSLQKCKIKLTSSFGNRFWFIIELENEG